MERVVAYVDGFNLYFGLKSRGWRRYYWLNICLLAENLLKPTQQLEAVKYFTARISGPPDKRKRQSTYIEALETQGNLTIFYGKYQFNPRTCRNCGHTISVPSEKMTDVNISVELMADAFQDSFDTAILISADSDLTGPVSAVRRLFPTKRVVVAFPPQRYSVELARLASATFPIGRAQLAKSVFPPTVRKSDGFLLSCPPSWR
jgi:uncharacterized LabA/DUF88 family protein